MLAWLSVWSKVQTCILPSWCHCHSLSLASVKSRLVLSFWYQLTRVVSEKRAVKWVCVMWIVCSVSKSTCNYLHCLHSMQSRVYATVRCLSICLFVPCSCHMLLLRGCCCGPSGPEITIDCYTANAQHQLCPVAKCGQCLIVSWCRKLNTDLFYF